MTSPLFKPARSAGEPETTIAIRGRTERPKSGSSPTYPRSYLVLGLGTTSSAVRAPLRSISTRSFSRAFIPNTNWTSRHRGVSFPLTATMRSPGRNPASAPGDFSSTTLTTGASSSYAGTRTPIANTAVCRTSASRMFMSGPASRISARCQRFPTGGASVEVPSAIVDSSGPRPMTRT